MEEIIGKVFDRPEATQLKFMYYKQRHIQPVVFFKAVQMQRKHEQSHRVIAVEGLHPDHHFLFEVTLRKTFPQIIAVLPTSRTHQTNVYGSPKGRYNLLTSTSDFASIARQVAENFPAMYYQHLENQGIDVQEEVFQAPKVVSRIPDQMIHLVPPYLLAADQHFSLLLPHITIIFNLTWLILTNIPR